MEENLQLFQEMKNGKYKDGEKVLRAKIDMSAPNVVMRDPVIYRILHSTHHRTGNTWCIYPLYDLRILFLMLLKELPNLSVRWNLRKDVLYIIGVSRHLTGRKTEAD